MSKIDERIEALEAKLEQLKVQHQRKEIRARTATTKRARGEELRALTRADDRALCELSAKL
jgi:hypothetical protein